ncbi:MAG: MotA/TolQ/ExbB proton channel family protein [Candidatus Omnitrophica bacterium]|nr:MotA/TolQ/ExbB proton channel family protein [Candidatus Omnitrophota bacterium]MCB9721812.1 MotA/TolQ/ExbB proton channel family protein [Candidatus Omnitrophota bacterium]
MGTSIWEMNAISLIKMGGPLMIPLIICSVVALGIIIERLIYFASIRTNVRQLKKAVFDDIKHNNIKQAIERCDQSRSPAAKVMQAGIVKFGATRDEIKEAMEDASLFEIPKLESRLGAMATIAHVSPLLGLLGTVTGMTASFHTVQVRAASMNPTTPGDLAGAIGEALLTTVAGLMVAIPTYVVYNYFVNRVNHFVLDMERAATELVNFMTQITETKV